VKSTKELDAAQQFIDFLLTDAQVDIATANIMYPSNSSVVLPTAFESAPKPPRSIMLESEVIAKYRDSWLTDWVEVMSK
jgi:thiamine transport system substrate-binding protein